MRNINYQNTTILELKWKIMTNNIIYCYDKLSIVNKTFLSTIIWKLLNKTIIVWITNEKSKKQEFLR